MPTFLHYKAKQCLVCHLRIPSGPTHTTFHLLELTLLITLDLRECMLASRRSLSIFLLPDQTLQADLARITFCLTPQDNNLPWIYKPLNTSHIQEEKNSKTTLLYITERISSWILHPTVWLQIQRTVFSQTLVRTSPLLR